MLAQGKSTMRAFAGATATSGYAQKREQQPAKQQPAQQMTFRLCANALGRDPFGDYLKRSTSGGTTVTLHFNKLKSPKPVGET